MPVLESRKSRANRRQLPGNELLTLGCWAEPPNFRPMGGRWLRAALHSVLSATELPLSLVYQVINWHFADGFSSKVVPELSALDRMHHPDYQNSKRLNLDTKIHESKGSFCIDALLSRNEERAPSPEMTRSTSSTSTRSRSPPISPGCEEVSTTAFVPRPGLLNQASYLNSNALYAYPGPPQNSAFQSLDGGLMQKVHIPMNPHSQFHQIQMEWLARTGMFYPRLQDLTGNSSSDAFQSSY
ncbi:hypothetical protein HUJ05_006928 [Dendroctonus ponderosae]|nr:hypothetical protein HUJ05_006928 [Dendroctonus ponderosae]